MRKQPRQQRSRALVESLLDATLLCIAREGLNAATTARIARYAGISVGSLYQYFDRKEDLYAAVLSRFVDEMSSLIDDQYARMPQASLSEFVREMLNAIWDFLERNEARYLHLSRHWNQMDSGRYLSALEHKMLMVISQVLLRHPPPQPVADVQVRTYVLVNGIMLTLIRYIAEPAPGISRDQLIDQFSNLAQWLIHAPQ